MDSWEIVWLDTGEQLGVALPRAHVTRGVPRYVRSGAHKDNRRVKRLVTQKK